MGKQMAFYFDASACNGCKACVIACKSKNELPTGVNFRKVYQYGGGSWNPDPQYPDCMVPGNMFAYSMSVSCMHCENPSCVNACPASAITKRDEDGIVVVDAEKCVGCRYCEWACPYAAPQFDEAKGTMQKCDMCVDLVENGETPYCVDACVMRALDFGELEELRAKYGSEAAIEPLPPADLTNPSLVIKPHKHAQPSGQGTGHLFDDEV